MRLTWPQMSDNDLEWATRGELCDGAHWLTRPLTEPDRAKFMAADRALIQSRVADYREARAKHVQHWDECLAILEPFRRPDGYVDRSKLTAEATAGYQGALLAWEQSDPDVLDLADVVLDPFVDHLRLEIEIRPEPDNAA